VKHVGSGRHCSYSQQTVRDGMAEAARANGTGQDHLRVPCSHYLQPTRTC
jgi:hypothetical protein